MGVFLEMETEKVDFKKDLIFRSAQQPSIQLDT